MAEPIESWFAESESQLNPEAPEFQIQQRERDNEGILQQSLVWGDIGRQNTEAFDPRLSNSYSYSSSSFSQQHQIETPSYSARDEYATALGLEIPIQWRGNAPLNQNVQEMLLLEHYATQKGVSAGMVKLISDFVENLLQQQEEERIRTQLQQTIVAVHQVDEPRSSNAPFVKEENSHLELTSNTL